MTNDFASRDSNDGGMMAWNDQRPNAKYQEAAQIRVSSRGGVGVDGTWTVSTALKARWLLRVNSLVEISRESQRCSLVRGGGILDFVHKSVDRGADVLQSAVS